MDGLAFFWRRPSYAVCRETEDGEGPAGYVHMTPVRRLLEEWMAMAMHGEMDGFPREVLTRRSWSACMRLRCARVLTAVGPESDQATRVPAREHMMWRLFLARNGHWPWLTVTFVQDPNMRA